MQFDYINKEIRQLRDNCPQTCNSISGNGQGSVCRCPCPEPEVPPPPVPPKQCCVTRIITRNSGRYLVNDNGTIQKVCC